MSRTILGPLKGRGTLSNPPGRFERQDLEEVHDGARPCPRHHNNQQLTRAMHTWGLSAGIDFETRLFRLTEHFPDRAAHVMSLIRDMRGGRDYDSTFGDRMRGTGPIADLLRNRFKIACRRLGLNSGSREMPHQTHLFRPPLREGPQLSLGF